MVPNLGIVPWRNLENHPYLVPRFFQLKKYLFSSGMFQPFLSIRRFPLVPMKNPIESQKNCPLNPLRSHEIAMNSSISWWLNMFQLPISQRSSPQILIKISSSLPSPSQVLDSTRKALEAEKAPGRRTNWWVVKNGDFIVPFPVIYWRFDAASWAWTVGIKGRYQWWFEATPYGIFHGNLWDFMGIFHGILTWIPGLHGDLMVT